MSEQKDLLDFHPCDILRNRTFQIVAERPDRISLVSCGENTNKMITEDIEKLQFPMFLPNQRQIR